MLTATILLVACVLGGAQARARERTVDLEDAHLDVPQLIAKYGYPVEVHSTVTSDGYILEMHRIPHGRDNNNDPSVQRPVVFVMHGLISSSADYVIMGPGQSLGYILAEEGFDVWLGNARGNYYSRRHISSNPNSGSSFWNFSWEEIGNFDLPAMVDHVLAITGRKALHYIGHSQGTTTWLVLNSLRPEYNDKFKSTHLMAPVAFMDHLNSPMLSSLASYATLLMNLGSVIGLNELFARHSTFEFVDGEPRCVQSNPLSSFCDEFIDLFASQSQDQFNQDMLPVLFGHTPSGSSLKQFAHYGQVMDGQSFRRWSFTLTLQNVRAYGSTRPPAFNLTGVTAPVKLHYSMADTLTPEQDVHALHSVLPRSELRRVIKETFTHFDFAWGNDARAIVYDDIIESMRAVEIDRPL